MEAGFRRGLPQTGGTPGTTGTEENMIRSSVEKRQWRFRCVISNTRIQNPSELLEEVEAEAEGSRDVEEVQRNPGLLVQPCGENSL